MIIPTRLLKRIFKFFQLYVLLHKNFCFSLGKIYFGLLDSLYPGEGMFNMGTAAVTGHSGNFISIFHLNSKSVEIFNFNL